ncbi:MAG: YIP1 family protein [Comamonadaceae bacterium]|nr:YIP1 family protein [Comamonadaceae bacterium]
MDIVERVKAILLKPAETWPVIEQEPTDTGRIYKEYLLILAAIPAVASFIGLSLIGFGGFGMSFRVPLLAGLGNMIVSYVLSLVMIYVMSLIANALAPTFGGEKNQLNALKLMAYGSTAAMVGGIFSLLPMLSMLGLLAALYSIYLIYTGIPVLMKAPGSKAAGYTAVLVVCGIVAGVVLAAASALFGGGRGMAPMMGEGSPNMSIKVPGAEISLDTAKLEQAARKMEEAGKRMEEAQAKGDTAAAGKAMSEMFGAAMGGQGGTPFSPDELQKFVPQTLGGMERTEFESRSDAAMGMNMSSVTARYQGNDTSMNVKVQDIGSVPALAMAMGAWAQSTVNRETADEVERIFQRDGVSFKEEYRKDGSRSEMTMMLANGIMVEFEGRNMDMDALRTAAARVDVKQLAAMKRAK